MLDADTDTYTFGGRGRGVQMHSKPLHFEVQGRAAKQNKKNLLGHSNHDDEHFAKTL